MQSPEIWADQKKASQLGSEIREIKDNLEFVEKYQSILDDAEIAEEISDPDLIKESCENLKDMSKAQQRLESRAFR